jgi:hypothetical protein
VALSMEAAPASPRWWSLSSQGWLLLVGGLLVRELFSFWTGHPYDFESWVRTGYQVSRGANPYNGFLPPVPGVSFGYTSQSISSAAYLPFWPLVLGGLYRLWEVVGGGNRFALYFLLKQPAILADVASAYLLYRLALRWTFDERAAIGVLAFWSFFSYAIVITAIWGQFDSIVVVILLFLLWARGLLERNLLYGLGIFVKWVTVIFLPLEFLRERRFRRLGVLIAVAVPIALTVAVFAAEGWSISFLTDVSTSQVHGGGLGMNLAFPLSLTGVVNVLSAIPDFYNVIQYAWVPGVILAGWVGAKWVGGNDPRSELRAMLLVVTVFLLLRWGLEEQYMLYLFAPVALDVATFHPGRRALLLFTFVLSALYLLVNNDLGLRFLTPADPGILTFTTAVDASSGWGMARTVALTILSILVAVTLVQWVRAILRDEPRPRPWLLAWWPVSEPRTSPTANP